MHVQGTTAEAIESVSTNGLPIYAMLAQRSQADRLVCFMPAAQTGAGTRRFKLFSRWSWQTEMPNQHVLALSDPALGIDDEIRGAWYLHPSHDLMIDMAQLVADQAAKLGIANESVLFYGSSLGGFGAMGMASLLPGASAIAEIPQIDVSLWPSPGSIKAMETRILGTSFSEHRLRHPEMIDVRERFKKSGLVPPFALFSNSTDMSIGIQREFMTDVMESSLPKLGKQQLLLTDHISGHYALPRQDALALINHWSINGDLASIESVEFELSI